MLILLHGFAWQADLWFPPPQFFPQLDENSALTAADKENCRHLASFWKVYVPDWFGKTVAAHVEKMYRVGYFDRIALQDFDHGHLLLYLPDDKEDFCSLEEILISVHSILYHTHEKTMKWVRERARGLSSGECTPRSIVGFMNGAICPAKDYCNEKNFANNPYDSNGTISDKTIKEIFKIYRINKQERILINGKIYYPMFLLNIEKEERGRYNIAGQRYDIHLIFSNKK